MGWGVIWNSSAGGFVIQNPPGAANWSIDNSGQEQTAAIKINLPHGLIESPNHAVLPASLYRAQLAEQLGKRTLKALDPLGQVGIQVDWKTV
jgi:hypothetical protein